MLRSIAKIGFGKLYMERYIKRSEFFKRLNTLIPLGRDGEINKKIYQKS
ncbi:MAG: hypothetical protein ACMUEL_05425 [Flavobacteriales bacterium Tduv]